MRFNQGSAGVVAVVLACSAAWSAAAPVPPAGVQAQEAPGRSANLLAVLDEHYGWLLRENPLLASRVGVDRYATLLRDESPEAYIRRRSELADRLARLELIRGSLAHDEDRLDADLLKYEIGRSLADASNYPEQLPLDNRQGPQIWLPQMADSLAFSTPADYENFASRLERVGPLIDQHIEQMRAGVKAGRVHPAVVLTGVAEQCRAVASPSVRQEPTGSPFYRPFIELPATNPAAVRAREAIKNGIVPAFQRLETFLVEEYLPAARQEIGASRGVDGPAFYAAQLKRHTTTELTPAEVHAIGLSEVSRIRNEMMGVIRRSDFAGNSTLTGDRLFAAFVEYLRTDPRFYYDSAEDLLSGYRDIAKRVDAELPRLFGHLPRTPYGVREMPPLTARLSPTAYYFPGSLATGVAGYFVANTYRLDQRPKYEMIALTMHEAVPGHHLQIAIAQELDGVHPLRRLSDYTAFVEGWALYAERLGLEVGGPGAAPNSTGGTGLYADPYDDFGRLTYEMWRACRLVVDTGIHAMDWPRERAIEFMLANTALSRLNVEREIDRYIAWPGQACAYKLGELKIRELRRRAEERLGDRFRIREFHDVVLLGGALPLPVLERRVDRWIDRTARE